MTRHYLTGVAAIALALGVAAAGAQKVEQNVDRQPGDRQPEQGSNQQQGAQQPNPPATTGQPQPQGSQGRDKQQSAETEKGDRSGLIAVDEREQTRINDIVRRQRIQPVTNVNFSLRAAASVPSSVRLSRMTGDLADIFPHYRDFSFFVTKQELVIVDPQSGFIVAFVPTSAGSTVGTAPPRENIGAVGTAEPPAPAKRKAVRTEKERVTATEEKPRARRPGHTETDVTVGASRREIDEVDELPPRDRVIGPPVRERWHEEGPPFPFSLLFGRWN
jgi:hypothetical protein